jgi:cell wall-associated NlpC family hydrolase
MGRVKGAGVDCGTFLISVFEEAGLIEHVELEHYSNEWHMHHTEDLYLMKLLRYGHKVEVPLPGDIALYKYGLTSAHGAIVIDYPTLIHAPLRGKVTPFNDQPIRHRLTGFYSYWGAK